MLPEAACSSPLPTVTTVTDRAKNQSDCRIRARVEKNKYMLFAFARGLEYGPRPAASGRAQYQGHSISQYGPT